MAEEAAAAMVPATSWGWVAPVASEGSVVVARAAVWAVWEEEGGEAAASEGTGLGAADWAAVAIATAAAAAAVATAEEAEGKGSGMRGVYCRLLDS